MIESAKTGDITIAVSPTSFVLKESPDLGMIELPYVFPTLESARQTLRGHWGRSALDKLESSGLYGLGFMESGYRHLSNSKKPIKLPSDMEGLKFRTMQVPAHVAYWNSLGSSAEGAPFPELYSSLSTKVFDGQENPIAQFYTQKFFEVQPYLTLTGHVYTTYVPMMNIDYWNSLTEEEKKIVVESIDEASLYQFALVDAEEKDQLKEIENDDV